MALPRDPREDVAQADALAVWDMERTERRLARRSAHDEQIVDEGEGSVVLAVVGIVVTLAGFAAAIGLIASLAVAWNTSGEDRFGWYLGLVVSGVTVGYSYLFRKHPDEVTR